MKKLIKAIIGEKLYTKLFLLKQKIKYNRRYSKLDRKAIIVKTFYERMGRKIDLDNPKTLNEKINWLMLNWYDSIAIKCADKYLVREVVEERYGDEILNELYGVWDDARDIDWDTLPDKYILKVNNGCGGHIICKDKSKINKKEAIKILNEGLKKNYAIYHNEWCYDNIKPKIICEKLLEENGGAPSDYKIFCNYGVPKFLFVATERDVLPKFDFFDTEFTKIPVKQHYNNSDKIVPNPKNFEKMIDIASKLSGDMPFVRVDFYNIDGKIIFGEYTFFHFSGGERFEPDEFDKKFGDMIDISDLIKSKSGQ